MEEAGVCSVCLEGYLDAKGSVPRQLQCCHTFCESCLDDLPVIQNTLRCPTCRGNTPIPLGGVKDLPRNFALLEVLGILHEGKKDKREKEKGIECEKPCDESSKKKAAPLCLNCIEADKEKEKEGSGGSEEVAVATWYCCSCEAYLCSRCDEQLHSYPMTRRHERVEPSKAPPPKIYCKQHPDTPLQLWCERDSTPVCSLCCHTTHRGHNICSLDDAWKKMRDGVVEVVGVCERGMGELEAEQKRLREAEEVRSASTTLAVEEIREFFEEVTNAVKAREKALIAELDEHEKGEHEKALQQQQEVQEAIERLKDVAKEAQEVVEDRHGWLVESAQGPPPSPSPPPPPLSPSPPP